MVAKSYGYDLDGNRVRKTEGAVTMTYTYDRTDVLVAQDNGVVTSFTHDPYGNLTAKAERASTLTAMTYDAAGRLVAITPASGNSATGTTRSLLDLDGTRLAVKAGAGAASFTLFDQLGSLVGLVDGGRTITGATRYDGYGETVGTSGTASPSATTHRRSVPSPRWTRSQASS